MDRKVFLKSMAIFWTIFVVFYTTFSRMARIFQGNCRLVGLLDGSTSGERGTQPLYYYAFVQIPMYEYLPALGVLIAFVIGLKEAFLCFD